MRLFTFCAYSNLARRLSIPAKVMRKWVICVHFHTYVATLNLKQNTIGPCILHQGTETHQIKPCPTNSYRTNAYQPSLKSKSKLQISTLINKTLLWNFLMREFNLGRLKSNAISLTA